MRMEMGKVVINLGTWTLPWKRREGAGIALFESRLRIAKKLPFWQTVGHGICPNRALRSSLAALNPTSWRQRTKATRMQILLKGG